MPPPGSGGGAHSLAREGLGSPSSDEGTYTVVLFIYTYVLVGGGEGLQKCTLIDERGKVKMKGNKIMNIMLRDE